MTTEMLITKSGCDCSVAVELAATIKKTYDTDNKHLTSIKVCINPRYQKANIFAGYEDCSRPLESGSEETMSSLCDALIIWPHMQSKENTEATWKDFSYAKKQMERALLLSEELNQQFIILSYDDNLKCYFKNDKAYIERV